ncbi:xylose isomerase-like [Notothenia coriiceps]|uniref:xylose isomerase n=1 Tax=Notothenia coriiceps TaxID=8208 RepID=A0A6I9PM94_9TELE|nr:PREDICTED: xylose isomerase-like [Notothenia coriiceps]
MGRKMEDWLRFSVCYWHSFCGTADPFGAPTLHRPWNKGTPMESAKKRLRAAFEFFTKLGVKYYTFHDRIRGRNTAVPTPEASPSSAAALELLRTSFSRCTSSEPRYIMHHT